MKNKKYIASNLKNIIPFVLSFISTLGINGLITITSEQVTNNSFVYFIFFALFLFTFSKIKILKKGYTVFSIIFSVFLSLVLIIGSQLEFYSEIIWSFATLIKIIALSVSIFPLNYLLLKYVDKFKIQKSDNINYKKIFVITFLIILFFNFLVFLALYPGEYGYDAGFQIMEILEKDVQITSHFSLLFSFILAKVVNLGKVLFGSYQVGFGIYCFLQMTFLSYVATKITVFCVKRIPNKIIYFINVLFFSFFPLYTLMSISAAQDSVFAGLFCLIILNVIELIENKDYWKNKLKPISLGILIFLLCLIRNNGFYCILISIPFIFLSCKNKKVVVLLIFIIPLFAYKIYSGPVFNILGVTKTDTFREMLSIPSQQFARVYNYNLKVFSKEELKQLKKFYPQIDDFKYYTYRQSIADPTKSVLNNKYVKSNLKDYISLWTSNGVKDPENYVEAFLLNSLGFWYPNKNYNDDRMYHPYIEIEMMDAAKWNPRYVQIKRESKFPIYEKILNITIGKNAWKRIPIISTIFTTGTYFIIFIFLFLLTILRRNFKYMLPISIILGLYATLFLSPVALFRYCFPIIMVSPLMINLILYQKKND
jgi:hypothetical protein